MAMAKMSVAEARKYLKVLNPTDDRIKELLELMDELSWAIINEIP